MKNSVIMKMPGPPPPSKARTQIPAKQVGGVESPATVILTPVHLDPGATWWSFEGLLMGGIEVSSGKVTPKGPEERTLIGYMPIPVPRSWGQKDFHVVVEYEAEEDDSHFRLGLFYGCGDPSELHLGETEPIEGSTGGKKRLSFRLDRTKILRNELFRASLVVIRKNNPGVLVYGVWLEVGVE